VKLLRVTTNGQLFNNTCRCAIYIRVEPKAWYSCFDLESQYGCKMGLEIHADTIYGQIETHWVCNQLTPHLTPSITRSLWKRSRDDRNIFAWEGFYFGNARISAEMVDAPLNELQIPRVCYFDHCKPSPPRLFMVLQISFERRLPTGKPWSVSCLVLCLDDVTTFAKFPVAFCLHAKSSLCYVLLFECWY